MPRHTMYMYAAADGNEVTLNLDPLALIDIMYAGMC